MKKLLIILGAGSSVEFGMPSSTEIDELFENWAKEIMPLENDKNQSLYSWMKAKLLEYYRQSRNNRLDVLMNFENILYAIQNLSAVLSDAEIPRFNHSLL